MRRKFIAGNWKMHKNQKEALDYINDFKLFVKDIDDIDIVLAVPFTLLSFISNQCKNSNINLCAQNVFYEKEGAFTGEISTSMIKDYANYVLIGHSERRNYFNETNDIVNKKINAALKENLKVILCVGESLKDRQQQKTNSVIETQFRESTSRLSIIDMKNLVIAYEPVWAIGTGKTATSAQAEEVHLFIRALIKFLYDDKTANNIRIIYGGSVNPDNASEILSMENIDGCLPGGASLDASSFANIIKS